MCRNIGVNFWYVSMRKSERKKARAKYKKPRPLHPKPKPKGKRLIGFDDL